MMIELGLAAAAYLALLFGVAEAAERGWIPAGVARHPLTFTLSLGVYATSWTLFGSIGLATRQGYGFLTIYLGVTLACLAIPFLWLPILRVVKNQRLSSLADLFAYRFQSQTAGGLVTVFMLVASLPYLALQVRAVSQSTQVLAPGADAGLIGLVFCATLAAFAILFGARHVGPSEAHPGLVVSMAFESLVKLLAVGAVGVYALFRAFGGPSGLSRWVGQNPDAVARLVEPAREGAWATLTLLSFSAAFLLPRQFHMAFAKQPRDASLIHGIWAFPLLLLGLNLPIPVILWAAQEMELRGSPDFFLIGVVADVPALSTLAFLGGVSASSGMIIVCSLALAGMAMNHLVLPLWTPMKDLYRTVIWLRRGLVVAVIFAGYATCQRLNGGVLAEMGLLTFVAVAQFLPGLVGLLFWPEASRGGFVAGLSVGILLWAALLIFPLLGVDGIQLSFQNMASVVGPDYADRWVVATWSSLTANGFTFAVVSMVFPPRPVEQRAAATCADNAWTAPARARRVPSELVRDLTQVLGEEVARREVERACDELGLNPHERRPLRLALLVERVETNLSGWVGPMVARQLVGGEAASRTADLADQVQFLEERLQSRTPLPSQAGAIDLVRRFFGGVLEDLPLGVCVLGPRGEVLVWNQVMVGISGLPRSRCVGHRVQELPAPWSGVLASDGTGQEAQHTVELAGRSRCLQVGGSDIGTGGFVYLVEDLTEQRMLQSRVAHHDRLQSIGRLAAGVAHEIGNPLAGILMVCRNLMAEPDADPEDARDRLKLVVSEASRIQKIVESLVAFSRSEGLPSSSAIDLQPVDLKGVVHDAVRLVQLTHRDVVCHANCAEALRVRGDPQKLTQVLVNLLSNACDASEAGADVRLWARGGPDRVQIRIEDRGSGMAPEVREHIFEPFFTTKEPGRGTGLGLAIVHRIVQQLGGSIDVDSVQGAGTRITVEFDAADSEARTVPVEEVA